MPRLEYLRLDLSNHAPKESEMDVLAEAGRDGWQLICLSIHGFAYMMRSLEDGPEATPAEQAGETGEVRPKYRDLKTGETWSGRGRMARWLKAKQDAGEDIETYRV
jgi:hypothetical protein